MGCVGQLLRSLRAQAHSACGWLGYRLGWRQLARRQFERVLLLRGADFTAYVHLGRIAFDAGDYASWRREFEHARRADPARFARLQHPLELFEPRLAGTRFEGLRFGAAGFGDGRAGSAESGRAGAAPGFGAARLDAPGNDANGFDVTGARATWRSLHPFGGSSFEAGTMDRAEPAGGAGAGGRALGATEGWSFPHRSSADGPDAAGSGEGQRGERSDLGRRDAPLPDAPLPDAPLPDASVHHDDCGSFRERRRFRDLGPIRADDVARCDFDELARRLAR